MYEMIILALLARWPLHGYLIAKITNDVLGPYARLSNGRLYPLLAKLEAAGLIVAAVDAEPETWCPTPTRIDLSAPALDGFIGSCGP